jgi:uncharacterized protein with ParB-like and HNH nuclease domain
MGRVEEMTTDTARMLLNRTIEALLSEGSIEQRLSEGETCLSRLEIYRTQIPGELDELKIVLNILASSEEHLSPEHELELTERLLTLYISVSDGALIF